METKIEQNQLLWRRVFGKNRELRGYVVADKERKVIGWSFCCKKDKFDKERGKQIALARFMKNNVISNLFNHQKQNHIPRPVQDIIRYFLVKQDS